MSVTISVDFAQGLRAHTFRPRGSLQIPHVTVEPQDFLCERFHVLRRAAGPDPLRVGGESLTPPLQPLVIAFQSEQGGGVANGLGVVNRAA